VLEPHKLIIEFVSFYQAATTEERRIGTAALIFDELEPDLRLFIFGKVHPNDAEDALQETFKAILRSLDSFRGTTGREFWAWCYQIARKKIVDHFRASSRVQFKKDEMARLIRLSTRSETLSVEDRMDLKYAMDLLEKCKPGCRDLLWNRFVIGLSHAEMGGEFSSKPEAVRMRVNRCLSVMRKLLGE